MFCYNIKWSIRKKQQQNYEKSFFFLFLLLLLSFSLDSSCQKIDKKCLKNVKQSAISNHLLTCDYNIKFNDFLFLSKDSNSINLRIKESLSISPDEPISNETVESFLFEFFEWQNLIILQSFDCSF